MDHNVLGPRRREVKLAAVPAALALAGAGAAALLAERLTSVVVLTAILFALTLRSRGGLRRAYLLGAVGSGLGVFLVWPFLTTAGYHVLWDGPTVPLLGQLDVTREELGMAALAGSRLTAFALAFSAYALLVDHDRLLAAAGYARRSAFPAVLATRLVPTLERDALGLAEAVRGRGILVEGIRGRAALVSPVVAGSLERALGLAEAMEARGFGRPGRTSAPAPPWSGLDRASVALAAVLVAAGVLWL